MSDAQEHIRKLLGWLRDSQLDLEFAAHCAGLGFWQWNLATDEVTWSDRCRELLGVPADTPASLNSFLAVIHAADREPVEQAARSARSERAHVDQEYRMVLPNGNIRWVHSAWRTLFDEAGTAVRASGVLLDVTERHAADEVRRRLAEHMQRFADATPLGVAMFDREMRYLTANERYVTAANLGDQSLIGRSIYEVFPHLPPHWRDTHQRCLGGVTERVCAEPLSRDDGSVTWSNWTIFPWRDERNEIGGIVMMVECLSKQRYMETLGRLWADAFIHSRRGIAIGDPVTTMLHSVNSTYARLLGYTTEELQGRSVLALFPESEQARLREACKAADAAGSHTLETCHLHRDGTLLPVELTVVSVRDENGRMLHRIATVSDLRERLRAEGELRQREAQLMAAERFRLLCQSAPIGILLTDPDGACTYANPAWLQITGLSIEQASDLGWWDAIHPDDRDRVSDAWERLVKGSEFELELRYQRASGETRWVCTRASAIRDKGGATIGYISTDMDITERLQQRAEVDRFHSQVRSLAQRLESLREQQRRDLAESLNGSLRHDLAALKSGMEALRKDAHVLPDAGEPVRHLAELAGQCLEGLLHITFELHPPGIEDLGFVGAIERYAGDRAAQTGLRIDVAAVSPIPELGHCCQMILYGIFQEALTNVIRHAHASRVEVTVSVQARVLRLRIGDDGRGMDEKDRNKPGCFGLLAASERLLQIGGTLRVFGVAGRGTTLDVSVPLDKRPMRDSCDT
ncbi:MAG: PAS domain-containing sensor histidine kinase [Steroidobacteraceae bacterium]